MTPVKPNKPEKPMNFQSVFGYVSKRPEKVVYFGPWWFALKEELRIRGFPVGDHDDPEIRARLERVCPDPIDRCIQAARHLRAHIGGYTNHIWPMPDGGAEVLVYDPDPFTYPR